MNIKSITPRLAPVATVTLMACVSALPVSSETPRAMTLLPDGQHHSFETGFNIDNPRAIRRAIRGYQKEATAAGMQVKPIDLDWSEIEPREGVYDLSEVTERLADYRDNGWRPLVFLRAIDSDDLVIPAYLKGTDAPVTLSDIDVSDPRFIARYTALLDQVVPVIRDYGGFAILVANEADNFLTPNPHLTDQVVTFIKAARDHVHRIDDQMAVGVALSNGFDHDDDTDTIRPPLPHFTAQIEAADLAVFNMYCHRVPVSEQPASVRARLQSRIDAAKGREIIFQELGCPSGGDPRLSEAYQRSYFENAYAAMEGTPVRVTVAFQLLDWTQGTINFYAEALQPLFAAEPAFAENPNLIFVYLDQLSSIGLINVEDGTPKPAWSAFLEAVRAAEARR